MAEFDLQLGHSTELRSGWPFDSVKLKTDKRTPDAGRLSVGLESLPKVLAGKHT